MNDNNTTHFATKEDKVLWIEQTILEFQNGTASPEEVDILRALMLEDAEARRIYFEANQLTNLLESAHAPIPQTSKKPRPIFLWATGLAAVLALGIYLITHQSPKPDTHSEGNPWLASLSSSHEAKWKGTGDILGKFQKGTIELQSGIAELEFQNGAQFVIEGPCELEIIDHDSIELVSGKLWGHCPPDAHGFEVLAPGGNRIVDLGTEFGVSVEPEGAMDVHVFDGEVELFAAGQEKRALLAGEGFQLAPGEDPFAINADFDRFTDVSELQHERWQDHQEAMLAREDLLLYYDFNSSQNQGKTLINRAGPSGTGKIRGAVPVMGRSSAKSALLFEKPGDAVAIDLESLPLGDGFTIAMWIKPTDFSKSHMALLNSDGFEAGDIHFQIHDDGRLMTGISELTRFSSPRGTIKTNVWQLVTVSWDLKKQQARFYLNGQPLENIRNNFAKKTPDTQANFGKCHLGTWARPTYGHNRSFVGRMDEVMIFSDTLENSEIEQLYESSRP